jgi:hypothetical protein
MAAKSEYVTVVSKSPNGVVLELLKPLVDGIGVPEVEASVTVKGWCQTPNAQIIHMPVTEHIAKTKVSRALWEEWLKRNPHNVLVKNGELFAESDDASAEAHFNELKGKRVGLEPLDPAAKMDNDSKPGTIYGMDQQDMPSEFVGQKQVAA